MKRIAILLLLSSGFCLAEEVTLARSTVLKAERTIISLKAGTVVELLGRDDKTLTIRHGKITGTIPATALSATAIEPPSKKEEPSGPPAKKAGTMYGKAVEKAKDNASKHDKNIVKPIDEILQ